MKNTKIEWAHHTINFWWGCTKVSPACAFCYAEAMARIWRQKEVQWGPTGARWLRHEKAGRDLHALAKAAHKKSVRERVFINSMSDTFEDHPALTHAREHLFTRMEEVHYALDCLLLTKRPENVLRMVPKSWLTNWPAHVWIGTTVEDQARADERIPLLLQIPARVRFLSMEPLLGPVDLWYPESVFPGGPAYCCSGIDCGCGGRPIDPPMLYGINWIIVGGESGPKARPMHPQWVQSIRDQCKSSGIPFHFKQWGEWAPGRGEDRYSETKPLRCMKPDGTFSWWAGDDDTTYNHSDNYEDHDIAIERVGKSSAGRLLDGVEHNGFPGGAS